MTLTLAIVRTRPRSKIAALVTFFLVLISIVVANVRERDRDEFAIPRFGSRKPQTAGYGWPCVAFRQPISVGTSHLLANQDFSGGDDTVVPARESRPRGWVSVHRPLSDVHIAYLIVNFVILSTILAGTLANALTWAKHGAHWSLRGMLIWLTCATVIFAQTSYDHVHLGWWNPREPYTVSCIEIMNAVVLAAGCVCGITFLTDKLLGGKVGQDVDSDIG